MFLSIFEPGAVIRDPAEAREFRQLLSEKEVELCPLCAWQVQNDLEQGLDHSDTCPASSVYWDTEEIVRVVEARLAE